MAAFILFLAPRVAAQSQPSLVYERHVFPENSPLVCVTFVSHHRFDLLERAMSAAFRHLDEDEPAWLRYEVAWFDNGSGEPAVNFAKRVQVEHVYISEHNLGLPAAINALVRRMCAAPFLMTLEEDWEFGGDSSAGPDWQKSPGAPAAVLLDTPARRTAVAAAAGLLAADGAEPHGGLAVVGDGTRRPILGVTLRSESLDTFIRAPRRSPWTMRAVVAPEAAGHQAAAWYKTVEYRTYCLDWSSGQVFGAYTNGAALYNRSRLLGLGRMYGDPNGVPNSNGGRVFYDHEVNVAGRRFPSHYGETNYAVRAGLLYCSATLRLEPGCEGLQDSIGGTCSAAFVHTGVGRGYGLEKRAAAKTTEDKDQVWMYAGTPIFEVALAMRRLVDMESDIQALASSNAAFGLATGSELVRLASIDAPLLGYSSSTEPRIARASETPTEQRAYDRSCAETKTDD